MCVNLTVPNHQVETLLENGLMKVCDDLTAAIDYIAGKEYDGAQVVVMEARALLDVLQSLVHGLRFHSTDCSAEDPAPAQ